VTLPCLSNPCAIFPETELCSRSRLLHLLTRIFKLNPFSFFRSRLFSSRATVSCLGMMIAMTEEEETAMEVEVAEAMVVAAEDVMEVETATEEAEEATEVAVVVMVGAA